MQTFHDHLDDYLNGTATPAQVAGLENALQADPNLRRALVERVLLEVHLRKAFAGIAQPAYSSRGRWLGWAAAAAVLLAVGIGLLAFWSRRDRADIGAMVEKKQPAVNQVISGKMQVDGIAVEQLPEDKWVDVAGDKPATIQLTDGSTMELSPSTRAKVQPQRAGIREAIELSQGAGKFRVTPGGGAFVVQTGLGQVTVLGTEFSVKLESRRRGEERRRKNRQVLSVTVTEGSVSVEADGKKTILRAGESRTFGRPARREEEDN